ncbi:MAG: DUF1385 domain-containing protein [Armatimonadota bacterium]|nr:DUF1385 domain-containing protein [Armatimonadota bacterium]MDR7444612.1 DUF1385 domain-containing protein [Armatimonadota bacterium]MDR7569438.1 DUF1385 domain-containing protein [Armatimonadota bacterium]MDR7613679.1 DUF1385 domain-containing protein [Armatimonadota bacterium]
MSAWGAGIAAGHIYRKGWEPRVWWAMSFPSGIMVVGPRVGCAWTLWGPPRAFSLRWWLFPAVGGWLVLLGLVRAMAGPWSAIQRLRRLHGAEHVVVGPELAPDEPPEPISTRCGATLAVASLPFLAAGYVVTGQTRGLIQLWALAWGEILRLTAFAEPRIRFVLLPGLWVQRLTTARPHPEDLEVARLALTHALGRPNVPRDPGPRSGCSGSPRGLGTP